MAEKEKPDRIEVEREGENRYTVTENILGPNGEIIGMRMGTVITRNKPCVRNGESLGKPKGKVKGQLPKAA